MPDGPTDAHPPAELLAAYVQGLAPAEARARLILHLSACDRCYRELLDVIKLLRDPEDPG